MVQAARRLTAKDTSGKWGQWRMTVLELAERLGNVTGASRRGGVDRTPLASDTAADAAIDRARLVVDFARQAA